MQRSVAKLSTADPSDVQQDIKPSAQSLKRERKGPRDVIFTPGDIEREFRDRAMRTELVERYPTNFRIIPRHADASSLLEKSPRRGQTNAAGPANNQASAAVEPAGTWHVRSLPTAPVRQIVENSIPDLEDRLDFDGDSARQSTHANSTPRADAGLSEHVFHQL